MAGAEIADLVFGLERLTDVEELLGQFKGGSDMTTVTRRKATKLSLGIFACLWATVGMFSPAAHAQDTVASFYKGNTIKILVPSRPGATFDLYARIFANHFSRHIPGEPNIIVDYMPAAGGLALVNHLYNVAPRDGTVIGNTVATTPALQLFRPDTAQYDSLKLNWLGSVSRDVYVLSVNRDAPATTLEQAKTAEITIGTIGQGNPTYFFPATINAIVGTKLKIISGYPGGNEIYKAMESGEVDGYSPVWLSLSTVKADWLREGRIALLAQSGATKLKELPDVPLLLDLAKTDEQRRMVLFLASLAPIGRATAAPPGVPADRLAALEKAFAETVRDPGFMREMEQRKLTVELSTKAQVVAAVRQVIQTPQKVIQQLRAIFGQ